MNRTLVIVLLMFANCQTNKESIIEIRSVDMDISTVISIRCEEFEDSFKNTEVRLKNINHKDSVHRFLEQISQLKPDNDKRNPDTRAKIVIKNPFKTDTICADRFSLKYLDNYYVMSDELRKDIWSN